MVAARPGPDQVPGQTLCVDAGYVGWPVRKACRKRNYLVELKSQQQERQAKIDLPGYRPRRWVVERTHSWLNRFRKLLVSFEKTEASYNAPLALACALICWRQTISMYG